MQLLKALEQIRTPFFDKFFLLVTQLGEELVFTVILLIVIWTISKKHGYQMFFIFTIGSLVNQVAKLIFKIQRPWTYDDGITPVKGSVEGAGGYSFPSGHTQQSVSLFGSIAMFLKKVWVYIAMIFLILIVAFSRMYLGVHTPADVFTSLGVGLILLFFSAFLFKKFDKYKYGDAYLFAIMGLVTAIAIVVLSFSKVDTEEFIGSVANGWRLLGCCIAMVIAIVADVKFIKFEVKAKWWQQIIKIVVGLGGVLAIKTFLKQPLLNLFNNHPIAEGTRYFLIILFAALIFPYFFKFLNPKARKEQ